MKPWPRLFHNLRASCANDWVERFPAHVVASWLGHTPVIAAKHYLQVRDTDFEMAVNKATPKQSGAECVAQSAQNAAQHPSAPVCTASQDEWQTPESAGVLQACASQCNAAQNKQVGLLDSNDPKNSPKKRPTLREAAHNAAHLLELSLAAAVSQKIQ